ncbi:MAG: bactofilin family protein [Bacillota bacterium]
MKTNKFLMIFMLGILMLTLPGQVLADEIVKLTGDILIEKDEVINGDVVAMTGDVRVLGTVNGNLTSFKGDIILEEGSVVNGDVVTVAGKVIKNSAQAVVNGSITQVGKPGLQIISDGSPNVKPEIRYINSHNNTNWGGIIFQLLGLGALTLLGFSLFNKGIEKMHYWLQENIGQVLLKGFLGWFALPFILIALIITILGIPIALITLILIPIPVIVGLWIVGLFTGHKVIPLVKKDWEQNVVIEGVTGVLIIWLAIKAPFIGFLVLPVIAVIGLGVILDSKFGTGKPWFKSRKGDGDHVS